MTISSAEVLPVCESSFMLRLKQEMNKLFVSADLAIQKLAQEAQKNSEQNQQFEAAQSLRIARHHIYHSFSEHLLADFKPDVSFDEDERHIASLKKLLSLNLQAWQTDSGLVASLRDFETRLESIDASLHSPLHPEGFINSFLHGLGEADLNVHTKMLLIRMFEAQIYTQLEELVRSANDALIEKGVLPELETAPSSITMTMNAIVDATYGEDQAQQVEVGAGQLEEALVELQVDDFEVFEQFIAPQQLFSWKPGAESRSLRTELEAGASELSAVQEADWKKLDIAKQIFDLLLGDTSLPLVARALLSKLQIPFSRIALLDAHFLNDDKHPAKELLSELVQLSLQWQVDDAQLEGDKFFSELVRIVQAFLEAERIENIKYRDMLFDLLVYAEAQRQQDALLSQRLIDSQFGASSTEEARKKVDEYLGAKLEDARITEAAKRFLEEGWNNVLFITAVKAGVESEEWQRVSSVVDDLLDTYSPVDSFSNRTEFLVKLPSLLKSIRVGMQSIALSPGLMNRMLVDLEAEHKRIVASINGSELDEAKLDQSREQARAFTPDFDFVHAEDSSKKAEKKDQGEQEVAETASDDPLQKEEEDAAVDSAPVATDLEEQARARLASLGQGSFIMWNKPTGAEKCRIAAFIKHTGKYILTDRSGAKVADFLEEDMVRMLVSGELEVVESGLVFEQALESVIGGIREKR